MAFGLALLALAAGSGCTTTAATKPSAIGPGLESDAEPEALQYAEPAGPILFTDAMVERAKTRVESGAQPWTAIFAEVKSSAASAADHRARPYQGPNTRSFHEAAQRDLGPARDAAFLYRLTGSEEALAAAKRLLLAWATADPLPGTTFELVPYAPDVPGGQHDSGEGLHLGIAAFEFALVYGLIDEALTGEERAQVLRWFQSLSAGVERGRQAWVESDYFGEQRYNNHLSTHLKGQLALSIALRDEARIRHVLSSEENPRDALEMIDGAVLMPARSADQFFWRDPSKETLPGEVYDRYRILTVKGGKGSGLHYAGLAINNLVMVPELARNVEGAPDLWSYEGPAGQSLQVVLEHYAPYYVTRDVEHYGSYHSNDWIYLGWLELYEIASARLPQSEPIREVLRANPKARVKRGHRRLGQMPTLAYDSPVPMPTSVGE